ncbi:hypothetical protein KXV22_006556 [Aspergillus fumigatus]|nr:hypothetical protein CNMCM8686_004072 [Aspergillus fumigatus]KAH1748440.1 hypothetical protein KXX09_006992 [Aspergillus fumigatus]KAH2286276.1 hypothetical protein KXV50_008090 [Aspergillus fumigatus]KAH3552002.1 hypothetical protein KXW20_002293 [Aspergillus fumigatus]KAH3578102.1 hypothetical protein KXV22_006556 [Aspergillus fumigatus]
MEVYKTRLSPHVLPSSPISTPLSILDATVARFAPAGAIWLWDRFSGNLPETDFIDCLQSLFVQTLSDYPQWAGQLQWAPVREGGNHTERFNRPMIVYGAPDDPGDEWRGSPSMQVQITLLKSGAFAIGIRMAHVLADAQTLMVFVHQWAATSRATFGSHNSKSLMDAPVFNPALLDAHAAGDVDGPAPDRGLVATARELPLHRFDWWKTDDPGYPKVLVPNTLNSMPSCEQLDSVELSPSTSAPWTSWDLSRRIRYTQIHSSGNQLADLKRTALAQSQEDISRLDALLAHLWISINRARNLTNCPDSVFLDLSIGTRTRLSPPLPDTFLGSPLFLTHPLFTSEKIGAMLHDDAYEISPQRLWQAFLGSRHVLVTSWLRLKVYKIDFVGDGNRPRYVHAVLPKLDGEVQVMESGVDVNGVDVAVYLEEEVMERILAEQRQITV